MNFLISQIERIFRAARESYGINPIIFITIYLICTPIFYYSLFRTIRAIAGKIGKDILTWSAIFLGANIAPFFYVILFGKNIPWWVFIMIALLISEGIITLMLKVNQHGR
jgi:hypothetical protein